MKKNLLYILTFTSLLLAKQAEAQKIFYAPKFKQQPVQQMDSSQLAYEIYLLGDIKPYKKEGAADLKTMKHFLEKSKIPSAVVLMGDVVYPLGMPNADEPSYKSAKEAIDRILNTFENYNNPVYIFAGNHDWERGRKEGWQHVLNLEKYIQNNAPENIRFSPSGGCPGPVEVDLTDDITLILLDSQWWLHQNEKPKPTDCDLQNEEDIFAKVEDIIKRNKEKKILVTAHHPLFSVGNHGGYFPASRNLFPLLDKKKYLYIPLPGFLYTGYRKYIGDIQDFAHPRYKFYRDKMLSIFQKYPDIIYAAGHEHNMQYRAQDSLYHIVSGGGGPGSYIARKKKKADFAYDNSGFVKLSFLKNGEVWITYYTNQGKILLRQKMFYKPVFNPEKEKKLLENYKPEQDSIVVRISDRYMKAGKFQRKMLGDNYRDIWNTPIKIPVFDIGKEKGGLTILKRGGGMQTLSVRLQAKDGKQYVLRSVDKNPSNALPEDFRNTFVEKPLQDAISASNPFGALTVPPLADAVGVMHTNPKLVYVPDDPRLGVYRQDLANKVFLFEERPAGNWEDAAFFGHSKKIVSTPKTLKKIMKKPDHRVDQKSVLKARLLDMLINDWDRHDDQWRWATFKENGKTIYRPIPRDRDQVYFVNQGLGMWLVTRKWALRKFQGFGDTIKDINGLNFNARYFDRTFLTELDKSDWQQAAKEIQEKLTDSVIHQAITKMPPKIYAKQGKLIEMHLQKRRDDLDKYAQTYYDFLSKEVDITGTKKDDYFQVKRMPGGQTKVSVFALHKKLKKPADTLYERIFNPEETKEIRLYGLDGKDRFYIEGKADKGIKIRIIGGKGKDSIVDTSDVKSWGKKTLVYDRKDKKNIIVGSKETKKFLSKNKEINKYDRFQFRYNKTIPLIDGGYNVDDGVFIGAGVKINRYNFRDKSLQTLKFKAALGSGAYAFSYKALFTGISPFYDAAINLELSMPENVDNFFGMGNKTPKLTDDKSYYRVRYHYATVNSMLIKKIQKKIDLKAGVFYKYYELTDTVNRFVGNKQLAGLPDTAYQSGQYLGLNIKTDWDTRDQLLQPQRGMHWQTEVAYFKDVDDIYDHWNIQSDLSLFLSFKQDPRTVFAFRFGGAKNYGDYAFYHANYLGASDNLRGYKNQRFAGDAMLFQNTEIRFKLGKIRSYLINGANGITLFNDVGRVWYEPEDSAKWHDGYGIEYWLVPFDATIIRLSLDKSEEDFFLNFKFSYLF